MKNQWKQNFVDCIDIKLSRADMLHRRCTRFEYKSVLYHMNEMVCDKIGN